MTRKQSNKPTGRRTEKNGRSKDDRKYTAFYRWMMETPAFKSLGPHEVRLLLELYSLYNGRNNGYLFLSTREAAKRCKMSKDKARECFRVLAERGFIRSRADEPKHYLAGEARNWILTEYAFRNGEPTKDFAKWRPEIGTECPEKRTKRTRMDETGSEMGENRDKNVIFLPSSVLNSAHR